MAQKANDAVNKGEVVFHPGNWDKTYFNWMDNIQDWCISRTNLVGTPHSCMA